MDEKYEDDGLEVIEEEFDDGMEDRLAEVEKNMDQMREAMNEDKFRSPYGREICPPEAIEHERYIPAEDVEKMVIDETNTEVPSDVRFEDSKIESDEDIGYSRIGENGEFVDITEEQFREAISGETLESYDQPDLVQEWENTYGNSVEVDGGDLSDHVDAFEALSDHISSEQEVDIISDDFGLDFEFDGDLGSEDDAEMDSEMDSEMDHDGIDSSR